jgi:hypothetical protein
MKKNWTFEIVSIVCFICFCVFVVVEDYIFHPIPIVFLIISILIMSIDIFDNKKTTTKKKIGLILLRLFIYIVVFLVYAYIVIYISWNSPSHYLY